MNENEKLDHLDIGLNKALKNICKSKDTQTTAIKEHKLCASEALRILTVPLSVPDLSKNITFTPEIEDFVTFEIETTDRNLDNAFLNPI